MATIARATPTHTKTPQKPSRWPAQGHAIVARLEQWPWLGFGAVTLLYAFWVVGQMLQRRPWYDELLAMHTARQPGLAAIWEVQRLDPMNVDPPLFHFLSHLLLPVAGDASWAVRLPGMVGFWVLIASLFAFVRPRWGTLAALLAMTFPVLTGAWRYAVEGRPYGLVLGCAGLALLCWSEAIAGRRRVAAALTLWLALATAVALHYFSVLVPLPLLAAEAFRTWRTRRVDWLVWAALLGSYAAVACYLPFLPAARVYKEHIYSAVTPDQFVLLYQHMLEPANAFLALAAGLWLLWRMVPGRNPEEASPAGLRSDAECVAVVGFVLFPVLGQALAYVGTRALEWRYILPTAIGLSVVMAALTGVPRRAHHRMLQFLLVCLALTFATAQAVPAWSKWLRRGPSAALAEGVLSRWGDLPVVGTDPQTLLPLHELTTPAVRSRLLFVADQEAELTYLGTDTVYRSVSALGRWTDVRLSALPPLLEQHPSFLLVGSPQARWSVVGRTLFERGARLQRIGSWDREPVFLVGPPPGRPAP